MERFDLEEGIAEWKANLKKQQGLEPGFIEELETSLRDRIEDYLYEGLDEKEAFLKARDKAMPEPEELADEYYKARTDGNKKPPWKRDSPLDRLPMHFKIGIRSLAKRKVYTILNVTGLAISICASFLIWLYVDEQESYDRHFENADRIYRIIFDVDYENAWAPQADVGLPVGPTLKADYPEVEEVARLRRVGATNTLSTDRYSLESSDFFVADDQLFRVFSIDLISGNPETALSEPKTVVLSEELAMKFFGRTDVVGEVIGYSGVVPTMEMKITGVMANMDEHTHIPFKALISFSTYFPESDLSNWLRKSYTYIQLTEQNDIASLRAKVPEFKERYLDDVFATIRATGSLLFQPLTDIYLDAEYLGEPYPHGNRSSLTILKAVMIFLLVMSCINYVNLATARSVDRAVEVGLRKTLGSSRSALIAQFMTESVLLSLVSGIVAIILATLLWPYYAQITNSQLPVSSFLELQTILSVLGVSVVIGILAGLYPAVYLTSFSVKTILNGRFATGSKGGTLRKSLIVSQYVLSSVLITWIITVTGQINYMKNKDVGFDKVGLIELTIPDDEAAMKSVDGFIKRVNELPNIRAATKTRTDISTYYAVGAQRMQNPDGEHVNTNMSTVSVGYDFIHAIGAEIVKGRDFDPKITNEKSVIINEAAAKEYGWTGRELEVNYLGVGRDGNVTGKWKVVGVVSNFKFGESYVGPGPMIFYLENSTRPRSRLLIGMDANYREQTIANIGAIWDEMFEIFPFEAQYVEDKFDALYGREETFLNLLAIASLIIVFITSLGIVGLISFTTELRKKEIALRKIVGASIEAILSLLSRQFMVLLTLASFIAIPLGYYITDRWLQDFPLNVGFSVWSFLLTLVACLLFTVLAIVYHALQAARSNPVEALRAD